MVWAEETDILLKHYLITEIVREMLELLKPHHPTKIVKDVLPLCPPPGGGSRYGRYKCYRLKKRLNKLKCSGYIA
jgi:hypothetical protein